MSWKNEEKCGALRANGVQLNQSAFQFPLGRPSGMTKRERDRIKNVCLNCPEDICIYEREVVSASS